MNRSIFSILLICYAFFFIGCEKEINEEPEEPLIRFLSMSQTELIEFEDRVIIEVQYEDGDGDLGDPNPDVHTIFVKDRRLADFDTYQLQPLAPIGEEVAITGSLTIELQPVFVLGNGTEEKTDFTIYIVDRAGNESNQIISPELTILKN